MSGAERVHDADAHVTEEGLDDGDARLGGVADQPAERDERRQTREVDEDGGRDGLHGQCVLEVGQVPLRLALDVVDQAAEEPARAHEARLLALATLDLLLVNRLLRFQRLLAGILKRKQQG